MDQQLLSHRAVRSLISASDPLPTGDVEPNPLSHSRDQRSTTSAGLHCIAKPTDKVSQSFDIVAIHGAMGHWERCWTNATTGFFWLRDSLPHQFPAAQIYFYSQGSTLDDVTETLLTDLLDERLIQSRSELPIIFIGLSLGGTLAKKIFIESSPSRNSKKEVKDFHSKIVGFAFMGTRQSGTFMVPSLKRLDYMNPLTTHKDRRTPIEDLHSLMDHVPGVNSDFKRLKGEHVPVACFYEGIETKLGNRGMMIVDRQDAIIENGLSSCHTRQISRSHNNLARFESLEDPELQRVLVTMGRLVCDALLPRDVLISQSQSEPHKLPFATLDASSPQTSVPSEIVTKKLRILSLDGGGVRGLFTVIVLEALMEEIRIVTKQEDDIKPCDFFDLIGGTSTGGLIALMLSRLRMDLISCKKQYRELSKIIFQKRRWSYPFKPAVDALFGRSWYPAKSLEASIKRLVAERITVRERKQLRACGRAAEEAPLRSEHVSRARCFVCAIRGGERGCARLRSYVSKSGEGDRICAIWEASRATSAAQLYFPPMKIGNETYWDGGSDSNNPVQQTYEEALLEFGDEPPLAGIVSIGTGMPAHCDPGTRARGVVNSFVARSTDTESTHLQLKKQHPQLKDIYFRLQGSLELGAIDLADWTKLNVIEEMAYEYLGSNDGRTAIENCARQLAQQ